jgi:hypothetical protein
MLFFTDLLSTAKRFSDHNVTTFSQMFFDPAKNAIVLGARYLIFEDIPAYDRDNMVIQSLITQKYTLKAYKHIFKKITLQTSLHEMKMFKKVNRLRIMS